MVGGRAEEREVVAPDHKSLIRESFGVAKQSHNGMVQIERDVGNSLGTESRFSFFCLTALEGSPILFSPQACDLFHFATALAHLVFRLPAVSLGISGWVQQNQTGV